MKLIQNWFSKHQHRQEKFVSLYDMMFDGCEVSYLSFRLSLFNLQVLFHFFSHMVMFYFMYHKLASRTFTILILVSAVKMLIAAGWWGGLEILRTQVRLAHHKGKKEVVNKTIGFWMILSLFLAIPVFFLSGYYGLKAYEAFIHRDPIIEDLFVASIFLSLAIQLPVGAYHAGIYGISRIMRPRFSMILSYLIGICILLLAWPQFKQYAILLSVIGESATSLLLTYYYTSYMYDLYKITPTKPPHQEFRKMVMDLPIVNFILGAIANIFIMSDALLIVGFYFLAFGDIRQLLFIQIIFLIAPLIRASSDWARLFYFDRKQLENDQLSIFISKYEKGVSRVASLLGFCYGVFATVACYILISPVAGQNTMMMIPFFLMRALIANQQVKAFTYHYYYDVIFSGILMTASLIGIYMLKITLPEKGILIAVGMIIINAYLKRYRLPSCFDAPFQNLYTNLYDWLSKLSKKQGILELYKLTLDDHATTQQKMNFIRRLTENFKIPGDQVCVFGNYPILFFKQQTGSESPSNAIFATLGAGIISKIDRNVLEYPPQAPYPMHLQNIKQCPIVQEFTKYSLDKHRSLPHFSTNVDDVTQYFFSLFPTGIYYSPERHLGPEACPLDYDTVRKFNSLIWQYLFQQRNGRQSDVDLSLLFEEGMVRVIFAIPFHPGSEEHYKRIREWHDYIHAVNIADSFQYAPTENEEALST